jgi:hypothetical protein
MEFVVHVSVVWRIVAGNLKGSLNKKHIVVLVMEGVIK